MTPTSRKNSLKGWDVTPEMLRRLPDVMFKIVTGDGESARDRVAASRPILAMAQQNFAREKGAPQEGRPVARIQLPDNGRAARSDRR